MKATVKRSIDTAARLLPCWLLRKGIDSGFVAPFYHVVSDEPLPHIGASYTFKNLREFEADLDFFLRQFRPVGLAEVLSSLDAGQPLPSNTFFLSFDDGLKEIYKVVAPLLLKKGVPATFFLTTCFLDNRDLFYRSKAVLLSAAVADVNDPGLIKEAGEILAEAGIRGPSLRERILAVTYERRAALDRIAPLFGVDFSEVLATRKPYLDSMQVRKLVESGFTVGAHSLDHPYYPSLPLDEQVRQTRESIRFVCDRFQVQYKAFAFPFGAVGVPQEEFYEAVVSDGTADVMFGTSPRQDANYPRCVQRLWMESPPKNARERVFGAHLKRRLRSLLR